MNEDHKVERYQEDTTFGRQVRAQAERKLKAQRDGSRSIWFGLGMSGLIGWSVTVPTLLGVAAGLWVDAHYPGPYSWTLMLLLLGLIIGCLNAWHWVAAQYKQMQEDLDE